MGISGSKLASNDALLLCKERTLRIKRVIDARNGLSAAQVSYIRSLRDVGAALRRLVDSEHPVESLSMHSEVDKSPSQSFYASPSPPNTVDFIGSPVHGGSLPSPLANVNHMTMTRSSALTITINPAAASEFIELESPSFLQPPPPLPPECSTSWDYFDSVKASEIHGSEMGLTLNFNRLKELRHVQVAEEIPLIEDLVRKSHEIEEQVIMDGRKPEETDPLQNHKGKLKQLDTATPRTHRSVEALVRTAIPYDPCTSKITEKTPIQSNACPKMEDPSEFITHRAKDFLTSMKDIEHKFLKAAGAGDEVSRMLETGKLKLSDGSDGSGKKSSFMSALNRVCCNQDCAQNNLKRITWNRSVSSSFKYPLVANDRDDATEGNSYFTEQFSMISGSHSSTLDRLYAWEVKLLDEIKASGFTRKAYDEKCDLLRHQSARGLNVMVIDKTRAMVKDLHSRVCVAIQAVDAISKKIEKLRDEELHPQLSELVQGFIRMRKAMLECHHMQFITMSLAYQVKGSTVGSLVEVRKEAVACLWQEMTQFAASFMNWVNTHASYVEALDSWLQICLLQPQEHRKGRRKQVFPPPQAISPPIFVLCARWLAGLKSLPSEELHESIMAIATGLQDSLEMQDGMQPDGRNADGTVKHAAATDLENLKTSLMRLFDRLTKFSDALLKLYQDVRQATEAACIAYRNVNLSSLG